jgi:hypothetical protein
MARQRRKESDNWARGIFASFWILLGCISGAYLFSAFSDPTLGGQLVKLSTLSGASGDTTSAAGGRDGELTEIRETLRELSQRVAELSAKLDLPEKAADASAPAPDSAPAEDMPAPPGPEVAESTKPADQPAPVGQPQPAEEPKPVDQPKPTQSEPPKPAEVPEPERKPVERAAPETSPGPQAAPQEPAPAPKPYEPPPVAVAPIDEPVEDEMATASEATPSGAPSQPEQQSTAQTSQPSASQAETSTQVAAVPPAGTDTPPLDPVALPPAANDGSTRYGIEIGVVAKQDALRPLWREYLTNHAALVAGLQPRRVLAPDKKWRLIAGPFASAAEATQACALFKKASRPCEATVYAGDSL